MGIGAAAGALEAFSELLHNLPVNTQMAFVLVQHLDPTHESILPKLLARATSMLVNTVKNGMVVRPNHVYVIPPNRSMAIAKDVLKLSARQDGRRPPRSIDGFLQSLAEERGNLAIGVILSGTASDGTFGLEAIKAEGGVTFAQDGPSAKFDSMPRSAIAAGCVDFVLAPAEIAREIGRISRHPSVAAPRASITGDGKKPAFSSGQEEGRGLVAPASREIAGSTEFARILAMVGQQTGVDFTPYKPNTLHRRIARRIVLSKRDSVPDYLKFLRDHPSEVQALHDDFLIGVTSFFRRPETFELLKRKIFPEILKNRTTDELLRVWMLGCSTGQVAYSLAMAWMEFAGDKPGYPSCQIFATDINEGAIQKARAGFYAKSVTQDVSPERLRRFFVEVEGGYRLNKTIREMCVFARQNVLNDPPFSRLDLISCRNLLIYLEAAVQKKVFPVFHYALKSSGVLWLGASESIGGFSDLFGPLDKHHRFYSKKPALVQPHFGAAVAQVETRDPAACACFAHGGRRRAARG